MITFADKQLTSTTLCKVLGIQRNTLTKWVKEGCPHKKKGQGYIFDQSKVQHWLDSQGRTTEPGQPIAKWSERIREARLKLTQEQAEKARLQREKVAGILHDVEECRGNRLRKIYTVKAALESLIIDCKTEMAGKSADQIETFLRERITKIENDFASD